VDGDGSAPSCRAGFHLQSAPLCVKKDLSADRG
jgi:hypothetical protein